jgi:hypothetical protein
MPQIPNFYSVSEIIKPINMRCHHDNDQCGPGKEIPLRDRRKGTGGYRLCDDCRQLT